MKTPWYEVTPGALASLLLGDFVDEDLYTVTFPTERLGVSALRYAAGPLDVVAAGLQWNSRGVAFDTAAARAVAHFAIGTGADSWQVVALPRDADLAGNQDPDRIGNATFLEALSAGAFDGATLQVDRAFAPDWNSIVQGGVNGPALAPTGIVTLFFGLLGALDLGRTGVAVTANSAMALLANPMPRRLYQAGCSHTLFDRGCTLRASDFAMAGAVAAVAADGASFTSSLGAPAGSGTYALGRVVMTGGSSQGFARAVRSWTAGSPATVKLIAPFPLGIAPGDAFTAYPGCDKRASTCALFQNGDNFDGQIGIPAPETAF